MARDVLIVDDEEDIRELISDILQDEGYATRMAGNSMAALAAIEERLPACVILDIWLQGSELDGLGILESVRKKHPALPVIMISGHGNIEMAVTSIKLGAYDYLEKPFKEDRLLLVVKRAMENARLRRENAELRSRVELDYELTGCSSSINQVRSVIERVAATSSRVMITGPAGVGKEVVARMIHKKSKRASEPFIVLNAASISPTQVDKELFGTGDVAIGTRSIGLLERAHGGTLYIDGIVDLPLAAQGKLLRVLQDQGFERPGSNQVVKIDVRVISSSVHDLKEAIASGKLREDLFYRLNVVPIHVPALSERKEDIPLLCKNLMERSARLIGLSLRDIREDAIAVMQSYDWPGNIRQLKNVIEWLLIMTSNNTPITANMLPPEITMSGTGVTTQSSISADIMSMPLREAREIFERQYLAAQLARFGNNISRTSSFIGMERSALHRKLKLLDITCTEPA